MWYCQCVADADRKFVILPGKEYVLGRRDCDIVIENDQSVSRKHAILQVTHPESNVTNTGKPAKIVLKDLSKFGTFVNNEKVKGERVLKSGDEIRFGTPKSIHRVVYEPFVVTTSCLDGTGKKDVKSLVCQLGGHVSNDWRKDCSFLVMKTLTVTIKTVCALISQKPIVTVDYLGHLLKYLKGGEKGERPDPQKYQPSITERLLGPGVSFLPMPERMSVFLGMTFYFLCQKQFQKMSLAVELGGGVPILSDDPKNADLEDFCEDKTVVMNPAPGEVTGKVQTDWVAKVKTYLEKKGKHMVQDAEVGYAVLYCSTEEYCNADKEVTHLLSAPPSQSQTQMGSLASQALSASSQASHSVPFRKPEGVTSGRNPAAVVKHSDNSGKGATGFEESQLGRSGQSMTIKSGEVFTVPESLTEETPKVRGQGQKGRRSRSPVPVQSIKEEPMFSEVSSVLPPRSGCGEWGVKEETDTAATPKHQTRSRSPAKPSLITDTEMSATVSQAPRGRNRGVIKIESGDLSSHPASSTMASEVLFDSELPTVSKIKKEKKEVLPDSKPVLLLDDEDDDDLMPIRKPPPSKKKRKMQDVSSEEEEENPFDFAKKRARKSPSPAPKAGQSERSRSPSPVPESRNSKGKDNSPSPAPEPRRSKRTSRSPSPLPETRGNRRGKRSPSPVPEPSSKRSRNTLQSEEEEKSSRRSSPKPQAGRSKAPSSRSNDSVSGEEAPAASGRNDNFSDKGTAAASRRRNDSFDDEETPAPSTSRAVPQSKSSRQNERPSLSQNGHHEPRATYGGPVPHGFLTTRQPIEDQVQINPHFVKEDIEAPLLNVEFEDLVVRPSKHQTAAEDQSDVPEGMMRWQGKLVPNFKKFRKVQHTGADQLPRIIGGRDLVEHTAESRDMMDDWLKQLQEADTQHSQREREAEQLFNWKPPGRGTKTKSRR